MNGSITVSERVGKMNKSAIHEMTKLSRARNDVAFLSWAKPTSDTPEHIKEAAMKAIKDGLVGGYSETQGLLKLREEIAGKLLTYNNIKTDPTEILTTVGAIEGLAAALLAVLDPGDEVILPSPTYSTHIRQVMLASARPVLIPLIEEEGYLWNLEALRKAITPKTKAILYCSPSNPTGTVFSQAQLREIADIAVKNDLIVITDEAYEYFVYDGRAHFSIASLHEMKDRVISTYTFTKTYAMTGWRIGYLHASAQWIPQITKAHIPMAICAPVVSQYAALAALQGSQECVNRFREHYRSMRDIMCGRLDELADYFAYQKPEGSYLMFPRIKREEGSDSLAFCKMLLREAGVSATPGIAFGPTGESHMRLSFCVTETAINKAFNRMANYFKNGKKY